MANSATDFVILRFPLQPVDPEVIAELKTLSDSGLIRIRDILFASRDEWGATNVRELFDVEAAVQAPWEDLVAGIDGLLSPADSEYFTQDLPPKGTIVAVLVEQCWANRIDRAMRKAGGAVVFHERIPGGIMSKLESLQAAGSAGDSSPAGADRGSG